MKLVRTSTFIALNDKCDKLIEESNAEIDLIVVSEPTEFEIYERYSIALEKMATNQLDNALLDFQSVFDTIENIPFSSKHHNEFYRLKSAVMRNLVDCFIGNGWIEKAIDYLYKLLQLKNEDTFHIWQRIGDLALDKRDLLHARICFEQAFELGHSFVSLDKLITVSYLLFDFAGCLQLIFAALKLANDYLKGYIIRDLIISHDKYWNEFWKHLCRVHSMSCYCFNVPTNEIYEEEKRKIINMIEKLSQNETCLSSQELLNISICRKHKSLWISFGQSLLEHYFAVINQYMLILNEINLENWINCLTDAKNKSTGSANLKNNDANEKLEVISHKTPTEESTYASQSIYVRDDNNIASVIDEPQSDCYANSRKRKLDQMALDEISTKRRSLRIFGCTLEESEDTEIRLSMFLPPWIGLKLEESKKLGFSPIFCSSKLEVIPVVASLIDQTLPEEFSAYDNEENLIRFCKRVNRLQLLEIMFEYLAYLNDNVYEWHADILFVYFRCYLCWFECTTFFQINEPVGDLVGYYRTFRVMLQFVELSYLLLYSIQVDIWDNCLELKKSAEEVANKSAALLNEWICRNDVVTPNGIEIQCRLRWIQAYQLLFQKQYDKAFNCFNDSVLLLQTVGKEKVHVVKVFNHLFQISQEQIQTKLDHIEHQRILNSVKHLYGLNRFDAVKDILDKALSDNICKFNRTDKLEHMQLLCCTLLRIKHYSRCAEKLIETLEFAVEAYRSEGNFEKRLHFAQYIDSCLNDLHTFLNAGHSCESYILKSPEDYLISLFRALLLLIERIVEQPCNVEYSFTMPFIDLYKVASAMELQSYTKDYAQEWLSRVCGSRVILATRALHILLYAHEELGKQQRCTDASGSLLTLFVSEMWSLLRSSKVMLPSGCVDDMLNCAEQCFFCLFNYPNKRKRHLCDHNSKKLQLRWHDVPLLFEFVKPETLPEFDDSRTNTINSEAEELLKRMETIIPTNLRPDPYLSVIQCYLSGDLRRLPRLPIFPETVTSEIYHLLADSSMKNKHWQEAAKYYQLDVVLRPNRFDSWCGLSLVKSTAVLDTLNSVDLSYDKNTVKRILRESMETLRAFEKAAELDKNHVTLQVERGSFAYQVCSFLSRALKQNNGSLTVTFVNKIKIRRHDLLFLAEKAYLCAIKTCQNENSIDLRTDVCQERWLHYYMMGKIREKLKYAILDILFCYQNALYLIYSEKEKFPDKIRYQNPQRFSFESLEVFYRAHVATLKYLMHAKDDVNYNDLCSLKQKLEIFRYSPFAKYEFGHNFQMSARATSDPTVIELIEIVTDRVLCEQERPHPSKSDCFAEHIHDDVIDCVKELVDDVVVNLSEGISTCLIDYCIDALLLCSRRFSINYKALYWLAHVHSCMEEIKDVEKAKQFLLGPISEEFNCSPALFQDRKQHNFYSSIWRIPFDDIDRAGSFATHMFTATSLAISVLQDTRNHQTLAYLASYLAARKQEPDKQYLRHVDRQRLAADAIAATYLSLRNSVQRSRYSSFRLHEICLDLYQSWLLIQKYLSDEQQKQWKSLLKVSVRLTLSLKEMPTLSCALEFCQTLVTEMQEKQQKAKLAAREEKQKLAWNLIVERNRQQP